MSVRCAVCEERLELVRTSREDTYQYGVVEVEHWRCPGENCRTGGHRVRELKEDNDVGPIVHISGPALDYVPEVVADVE